MRELEVMTAQDHQELTEHICGLLADATEWGAHITRLVNHPSSPHYVVDQPTRERVIAAITRQTNLLRYAERLARGEASPVEIRPGRPIE